MDLASGNGVVWRWQWIANLIRLRGYKVGAELGVKEGRTTSHLLSKEPALRLTAVDLWDLCPPNAAESYSDWKWKEIKEQFLRATAPFAARLTVLQMSTADAAVLLAAQGAKFDFVFIDADHSTEGVCKDIRAYRPLIRKGGMLIGHDIDWPSVKEAVRTECRVWAHSIFTKVVPGRGEVRCDNIWWSEVDG